MAGVLFLCVANSARSQLAEAIARHLAPDVDAWSAGTSPSHVRPQVYATLEAAGIDSRGLRSKGIRDVPLEEIDVVVSLCAEENCPLLPSRIRHIRWPLPDPTSAPDDEAEEAFEATRDELLRRLPKLLAELRKEN